jgi:hypothetical protein
MNRPSPTAPHLFDAFDRICIINLPERLDRRKQVTRELQAQGQAPDGQRVRFFAAARPDSAGDFPSIGARGCFLSHLEVLRQARADGVHSLLVLEDDVMFKPELGQAVALGAELLSASWQIAYPGHTAPPLPGPLRWQASREPLVCAHCYAVHHSAFDRLIDFLEACLRRPAGHPAGGPMHYDGALSSLRKAQPGLITLLASRSLAGQRSSRSDIIGPSWLDRLPMAAGVRALKNRLRRLTGSV